ncbi:Golgi transport complex subunit 5-domain-containing protein [Corynascus novoguineensis]|uniref:Conserved oligomeric Golgi complex subunit 5 n=1 Tax=Corynascus novoguineensis TaxID=1126955 RepID=A0AAN7HJJ7_9PEZI|nr:Golgi transport complex subunit 5-domain-containing protein [Corynascus novoguineensis]
MSTPITPTGPAAPDDDNEPSYIDYEAFLDPSFTAASFANTLVLATNNPSDTPLDLSTPLSRVLFDIQEIDSHIDSLTTRSALPLLQHTQTHAEASARILAQLQAQISALNESYAQLDREVTQKHAEADQVRAVASRLADALRLARAVSRCLQLGRRLEAQHAELNGTSAAASTTISSSTTTSLSSTTTTTTNATAPASGRGSSSSSSSSSREDHRALVRCAHTLLALREVFAGSGTPGAEGYGLDRVAVVRTLREGVVAPIERAVREAAERAVREFSMMGPATAASVGVSPSSTSSSASTSPATAATYAQLEETRARTVSALSTLWLLSPAPTKGGERWVPSLMLQALENYLRSALQSSIAGLSRALATLPNLERALTEVSARCQNVVALEAVLEGIKPPAHPSLPGKQAEQAGGNLLQPLLAHLETGSLASYYWRTMAGNLAPRVQEIVAKGGVSARTLKTNRQNVGEAIKECVARGSQLPSAVTAAAKGKARGSEADAGGKHWEREVAVMVGSVVNNLGR